MDEIGGRDTIHKSVVTDTMDEIVGSDTIQDLSKRIGHSWKDLGRHLGIKDVILDSIGRDFHTMEERSYHMFLSWRQRNGSSATYRQLSNGLMEVGRKDLADIIRAGSSGTAMDSSKGTTLTPKPLLPWLPWALSLVSLVTPSLTPSTLAVLVVPLGLMSASVLLLRRLESTSLQQRHTTVGTMKAELVSVSNELKQTDFLLGSEDLSSESTKKETKIANKQLEQELRKLKKRYVAVDRDRQQLMSRLHATTEELKVTKSSLAIAKKELSALQKDFEKTKEVLNSKENELEVTKSSLAVAKKELSALQDFEKTKEVLNRKENELEDTKSSLQTAKEELAKSQQQVKSDSEPHTKEALNKREIMSLSGSADHQLSQSDLVRDSPSSADLGDDQVKQIIGKEGGLLEISGTKVSLEIPPGALEENQLIEMRIIRQYYLDEPLSFYSNASVIVELLPNHLELQKEAVLTLPHCVVFKEGCEWEAEVYSSHHGTGSQQSLKLNPEIHSLVREQHCVLWLCSFSLWTILFDRNIAEGKRIILFAAKRKTSTNKSMLLDVGFYLKHTDAKQIILSHNVMLYEKEAKLYEEGSLPLRISFEEIEPDHWSLKDEKECLQTLTFEQIAKADCQSCTFRLRGDPSEPEDGTCTFKIWQKEKECSKLCFHLKDVEKSRYESAAMDRVVSLEDIEALSKEIGDSWVKIARALELIKADIENIRDDNKKQEVVAYEILLKWKQTNGNSATYSVLVKALRSAGRKDLGDDLEKKVNDPSAETDLQR